MRRVLCELREAVLEQAGKDQTDPLRHALHARRVHCEWPWRVQHNGRKADAVEPVDDAASTIGRQGRNEKT